MWQKIRSLGGFLVLTGMLFAARPASATVYATGYLGQVLSANPMGVTMAPGETKRVELEVKNLGTTTWRATDKAFPVLYTYFPKYRASAFRASNWLEQGISPMHYRGADVAQGKTAVIAFDITAPKTEGYYEEGFWLAAYNKTWIPGTQFKLAITVGSPKPQSSVPSSVPTAGTQDVTYIPPSVANFSATLMSRIEKVSLRGGAQGTLRIAVKNAGKDVWPGYAVRPSNVAQIASNVQFAMMETGKTVNPGALLILDIPYTAPAKRGEYTLAFVLNVAGQDVNGGYLELPVSVTDDANVPAPVVPTPSPINPAPSAQVIPEPALRVGLYKTTTGESIMGNVAYRVMDENGTVYFDQPANSSVTVSYEGGRYKAMSDSGMMAISAAPIRLVGRDAQAIFTVATRPNRPIWNDSLNDNSFRGVMEIRYAAKNDAIWIINEVPIEQYLKGLIEAGEGSTYPAEYQKALTVAARSYAFYHYSTKSKHLDRGFDVDAHYDQVYRGYGAESRQPRVSAAVEATRGMIVQYQGGLAVTPYYTRSDGRTRSYKEVWFKDVPYLVSVPAPYDNGKVMSGHGVGMSQWDAITRAKMEGLNWQQLVKYYYTGVDIAQKW